MMAISSLPLYSVPPCVNVWGTIPRSAAYDITATQKSVFFSLYLQVVVLTTVLQIQPPLHSLLVQLLSVLTFQSMMIICVKEMLMKLSTFCSPLLPLESCCHLHLLLYPLMIMTVSHYLVAHTSAHIQVFK